MTSKETLQLLSKNLPLTNLHIVELVIDGGTIWNNEIQITDCTIDNINCLCVMFEKPVILKNSLLKNVSFNFSYFKKGLTIENCIFYNYVDFEAGGHNELGNLITIINNEFREFVNFNDCWFTGEVNVSNNIFLKGSNIASKDQYLTFDLSPIIENNIGFTNIESDCRQ